MPSATTYLFSTSICNNCRVSRLGETLSQWLPSIRNGDFFFLFCVILFCSVLVQWVEAILIHTMTNFHLLKLINWGHFQCYMCAARSLGIYRVMQQNVFFQWTLTLNCIRGGFHGTQHLVFRLSHLNAAIFRADNFCNCPNSSCAFFGEKKNEVHRVVFCAN